VNREEHRCSESKGIRKSDERGEEQEGTKREGIFVRNEVKRPTVKLFDQQDLRVVRERESEVGRGKDS